MSYAEKTDVSIDRSESEIRRLLSRHGADQVMVAEDREKGSLIMFRLKRRTYRFKLPLPSRDDEEIATRGQKNGKRSPRPPAEIERMYEQACRSRWRALCLCIKAKLEAVAAGIVTFEDEFLPHVMVNSHQTAAEVMQPQLEHYYESGKAPLGLPMLTGPEDRDG